MHAKAQFIQGIFSFEGAGLDAPAGLGAAAIYRVPADKRAQIVYLRAGNSADALICLQLYRDGKLARYFPLGAKQSMHVPLAITEDVFPETTIELRISAPRAVAGVVIVDLGLLEVD